MPRRKSEAARVLAFFETAPLDVARTILGVIQVTLARRTPKAPPAARRRAGAPLLDGMAARPDDAPAREPQ